MYEVTPIFIACYYTYFDIVKLLMQDERVDVNIKNEYGDIPLFIACSFSRFDLVKLLIQNERVHVNVQNEDGNTALHRTTNQDTKNNDCRCKSQLEFEK